MKDLRTGLARRHLTRIEHRLVKRGQLAWYIQRGLTIRSYVRSYYQKVNYGGFVVE